MNTTQKNICLIVAKHNEYAEILLYGIIDNYDVSAGDFTRELRTLEQTHDKINVRINSAGGSVFEGIAIYNAIKNSKAEVNTYIDGLAASMASIIAMAGKKVYMSKVAQLMTHKPSAGSFGNSDDLRNNADLLDSLERTMAGIYASKTGKPAAECSTKFLNGTDNWFTAEQALAEGLVDEIYEDAGIEMPKKEAAATIKNMQQGYALQLVAKLKQITKTDKMDFNFSAEAKAALGITAEVTDVTIINKAITDLKAKADTADAAVVAKETAEQALADYKKQHEAAELKAVLDTAVSEKKMTVKMRNEFEQQFTGNLAGLKAIVATLTPYESKVPGPGVTGATDTAALVAEWDKLDKNNGLDKVKAENFDHYKALFEAKFNKPLNQ